MPEFVRDHILDKDAHAADMTTGDFLCLEFDGALHMLPKKLLPQGSLPFLRKGVRIRVTYDSQPPADPLVNSLTPTILEVSLVSPTPELYHVVIQTHFPQRVQQATAEHGTVIQTTRVQ